MFYFLGKKIELKLNSQQSGFTLMEIIVAVSIFVVIIMISGSLYVTAQRSYDFSQDKMELVQNGRVAFDRLSRELRQSVDIATPLASSSNEAEEEILFQNGHDLSEITYVFYYLDNTDLRRAKLAYYFDEEPDVYVKYNSTDEDDDLPEQEVLEDKIVAEHFTGLEFWEVEDLVHASTTLRRGGRQFRLNTGIYSRN